MLSFKTTFSLSSFTFIKRLFSSSSLSAIRVVASAYLKLLIFLLAILIPAYASSSPAFLMMYSAYLNKQGNFRLSTRFLVHHPVTSPSTNQKKVTHLGVLELPRKSSGSSCFFEQESLTLLAWPLQ